MKKYLMIVAVAVATASFTSCSNEVDMFEGINSDKASISLNITNDNVMFTRAESNVPNTSSWYVKVGNNEQIQVSALSSQKYAAGEYTIAVSNYATEAAAITEAKLTVSQSEAPNRVLNTDATTGYFYAGTGKTINYDLDYKYNGTAATTLHGSIADPAAATEYQVKVVTNSNGTITLTVSYDTEFDEHTVETITIDAATGEKAN